MTRLTEQEVAKLISKLNKYEAEAETAQDEQQKVCECVFDVGCGNPKQRLLLQILNSLEAGYQATKQSLRVSHTDT